MADEPHPLYDTWHAMIRRCHDPRHIRFHRYGARGVEVCPAWRSSFWHFVADLPPKTTAKDTLERIRNR